ncbi:MAG: HD domain-containing protein [Bdellovibrionales bacterium]|nr:HD domain-containing protein [Bdellovibrionales bacterium]
MQYIRYFQLPLVLLAFLTLERPCHAEKRRTYQLAETPIVELYSLNTSEGKRAAGPKNQTRNQIILKYFEISPVMLKNQKSSENSDPLGPWFRHDHLLYILNSFEDHKELLEFSELMSKILKFSHIGHSDIRYLLNEIPNHSKIIAKVSRINNVANLLKSQHKAIIRYAHQKHVTERDQKYAGKEYTQHLYNVKSVLREFGFGPKDSLEGLLLGSASLLHDVIEDTDATFEEIAELFSPEIAKIVLGVSKLSNSEQEGNILGPEDILKKTYQRTRELRLSVILKLADRISNVRQGLADYFSGQSSKVGKYFGEYRLFKEILYRDQEKDLQPMWDELDRLLSDPSYALEFVRKNQGRETSKIAVDAFANSKCIGFLKKI